MLKQIFIAGMISVLLIHTGSRAALLLLYQLDRGTFTEWFCINKGAPELQCNGQCHLSKIKKNSGDTLPFIPEWIKEIATDAAVLPDIATGLRSALSTKIFRKHWPPINHYKYLFKVFVFHPPQ